MRAASGLHLRTNRLDVDLLELGHDYLSAGLLDRAENILRELADSGDYPVQALRQLIDIYEQEKDWNKAIESARLLEKATGNHLSPVIAHYQCELAERFRESDDVDGALDQVKKALATDDRCVRASILEGDILTDLDEHERAIRAYQRVEEQDADYVPETIDRMQTCYRALDQAGDMDEYLNGLMKRYGWITLMLALADLKHDRDGTQSAIEFISDQLRRRTSVRAPGSLPGSLTLYSLDRLDGVPVLTAGTLPVQQPRWKTAVQALVYRPIRQELPGQVFQYGYVGTVLGVGTLELKLEQAIQAAHRRAATELIGNELDIPNTGGGAAGAGDGVGNIVELKIEKDLESLLLQLGDDFRALSCEELVADFQPAARRVESPHQYEGRRRFGVVQGHDDARAWITTWLTHPLLPG